MALALAAFALPAAAQTGKPPAAERVPAPDGQSGNAKPDGSKPEPSKPEANRSESAKPDRAALPKASSIKTAAQKAKALADLHERLVAADSNDSAEAVADTIEQMWLYSGSDTTNLLMERALQALNGKKPELALQILDGVVKLQPAYAEAWNRRAYVHFAQKDYSKALLDLQRVLALEPRHFKAINGLGTILREFGEKRGALKAYRMLLEVHPFAADAQQAVKELEREVEGESL
jgi:tetratricopeptide (TPR) repeat protein